MSEIDDKLDRLKQVWKRPPALVVRCAPVKEVPLGLEELTSQQVRVMRHLAEGYTVKETAELMFLAPNTVKSHRHRIYKILGIKTEGQAGAVAAKAGLV